MIWCWHDACTLLHGTLKEQTCFWQEWLAKLLMQQKELARLRAAIEAAKAGADTDDLQLHDIDEEEESEAEEADEEEEEVTEEELQVKPNSTPTLHKPPPQ